MLRASRHVGMHVPMDHRLLGATMHELAAIRVAPWASLPGVNAVALRGALADLEQVSALTGPNSDAVKADYIALLWAFDHPDAWIVRGDTRYDMYNTYPALHHLSAYFRRERDRSRRVARIIYAHWLTHADRSAERRPKMTESRSLGGDWYPDYPYYVAPGVRDSAHPLAPEKLFAWHLSAQYASHFRYAYHIQLAALDRERAAQASLLITIAEQLHLRERGKLPSTAHDSVTAGCL